ncbi:MAG: hypothetical protein NTU48_00325 [Legionellales bacterium]|nr:hypothetical protein [Legionellales bacterium]
MQFTTPLYERADLYEDFSEAHAVSHPPTLASQKEREIELMRVVDVAFDPVTRKKLPTAKLPFNVLESRRGHVVYVESFAFKPTAPELLAQMDFFLQNFIGMIQRHQINTEHHIVQIKEAFHFAFGSTVSPNIRERFFEQKRMEADRTSDSQRVCPSLRVAD